MVNEYYYIPSDIAIIQLNDGNVLFRSDNLSIKLEGNSAKFLVDIVFPLLDGFTSIDIVSDSCGIAVDELVENLEKLVISGVLRKRNSQIDRNSSPKNSFDNLLERLNLDSDETNGFLKSLHITIAGLEGSGVFVAIQLMQFGIRNFLLIDPFPLESVELSLFPFLTTDDTGKPRQEVFKKYFESIFENTKIEVSPVELNRAIIQDLIVETNFIIGCFDKGFISMHHWLNQVAIEKNIPAIFSEIENHIYKVGPLVLADETACFMCYRMREIACANDYTEAIGYETYLNQKKIPALHLRGFLPSSVSFIAGIISDEVIKLLLSLETALAGWVLELNSFNLNIQKHYINHKHDCPVCRKKKDWNRKHYSSEQLVNNNDLAAIIHDYKNILISPQMGIIKYFEAIPKDPDEPLIPYVYGVELSNHSFFSKQHGENETCSGKGLTIKNAEISALGEAVERYSGACFRKEEVYYSTYSQIEGAKFDPSKLVLFASEQYQNLPFSPFDVNHEMGWVKGYSLVHNAPIEVPAVSIFMNYTSISFTDNICPITSNGLAAGATLLNAILSASLEIIERDAFIIAWHNELACERIDPFTHPHQEIKDYCTSYERRGVELQLYHIPTDLPVHVFMGIGYQLKGDDGPCIVVGLGADFDPIVAAKSALLEIGQIRPALKQRIRTPKAQERLLQLLENPQAVNELEDHDLLYSSRKSVAAFNFLFKQPIITFDWRHTTNSNSENLMILIDFLRNKQSDLIYYNLTPPEMEKLGLYTVRAIIPDMQPIHFGTNNIRLGGERLFNLPYQLGLKKKRILPHELNQNPHPLA